MEITSNDFELQHITRFFSEHLDYFERLHESGVDVVTVRENVCLAASMQQSLIDLKSEDGGSYYRIPSHLNSVLDAEARLSRFLSDASKHVNEESLAILAPTTIDPFTVDLECGFRYFELDEYIDYLETNAFTLDSSLPEPIARVQYDYAETELIAYLQFIVAEKHNYSSGQAIKTISFMCLLRDTLLLYLGLRHLRRTGLSIEAHAILASRALLRSFSPNAANPLYEQLFDIFYDTLRQHSGTFDKAFFEKYRRRSEKAMSVEKIALHFFLRDYCERRLNPLSSCLAIDSGVHGNMPLLLKTTSKVITGFLMYTCVPWLQDFFGDLVFTKVSTRMRYVEALVCQEYLFDFARVEGAKIIIKESQDPIVRATAYAEIRRFLRTVEKAFPLAG